MEQDDRTLDVKNKWELELNTLIDDSDWEYSWEEWHKCLNSPNWKEFSWKLRMRFFKTPLIVSSYDHNTSALCWRNCGQIGDFSHIFWECPLVKVYREGVKGEINKILKINITYDFHQIILSDITSEAWEKDRTYMLKALVLIAHKIITINWLKPHPPTLEQWTQRLKSVNCMEEITAVLRLKRDLYLKRWSPVISYLDTT